MKSQKKPTSTTKTDTPEKKKKMPPPEERINLKKTPHRKYDLNFLIMLVWLNNWGIQLFDFRCQRGKDNEFI